MNSRTCGLNTQHFSTTCTIFLPESLIWSNRPIHAVKSPWCWVFIYLLPFRGRMDWHFPLEILPLFCLLLKNFKINPEEMNYIYRYSMAATLFNLQLNQFLLYFQYPGNNPLSSSIHCLFTSITFWYWVVTGEQSSS